MSDLDPSKITRRSALRLSSRATACWIGSSWALARDSFGQQARLAAGETSDFQKFCEHWLDIAGDYPHRELEEFPADEYLYRLCAGVSKLPAREIPPRQSTGWDKDGLKTGLVWSRGEIFVIEQELAPGTILRAHNHPAFNAVTMVSKGDCEYRHFEPIGEAPDYREQLGVPFQLQETHAGRLKLGRLTHLSRSRDNIHWFRAGENGATLIDFSMGFGGSPGDFSALEFDPKPLDRERRIHEGYWVGNPYK